MRLRRELPRRPAPVPHHSPRVTARGPGRRPPLPVPRQARRVQPVPPLGDDREDRELAVRGRSQVAAALDNVDNLYDTTSSHATMPSRFLET